MKVFAMVFGAGLPVLIGCAKPQAAGPAGATAKTDARREMALAWRSTALPTNAQSMAVKEGAAPLVYRVESGATIRVHDAASKADLARGFVPAGSLVRVDARRGVLFGGENLFAGPLAEGGRYVIFVEPNGENVARQGVFRPRPRDAQ